MIFATSLEGYHIHINFTYTYHCMRTLDVYHMFDMCTLVFKCAPTTQITQSVRWQNCCGI